MKIAFICASLEPGRDGVGDYTRRLAAACARFGHACLLLAINDRHVDCLTVEDDLAGTAVHRWPAEMPWAERTVAVQHELANFGPDCVSWQFVSYGFHPRGIVAPELIALARDLTSLRSQVTLHEIWIGVARGDPPWHRLTGWWQARSVLAFLRAVQPMHVQTSNPSYAAVLARHGWSATVLPVFSNIAVVPSSPEERAAAMLRHLPAGVDHTGRLVGITFGTLHPQWRPHEVARWMQSAAVQRGRDPVLLAVGRPGVYGPRILEEAAALGLKIAATGELPPAEVSLLLQSADFGIATHPWALLGKSGAVSAMLAHGLPVLVSRDDWRLRAGPAVPAMADPRLVRLTDLTADNTDPWLRRRHSPGDPFPTTVARFLQNLAA